MNDSKVAPLKKRVMVAELSDSKYRKSDSGIILEGAKSVREHASAVVLAIGPEVTDVAVGDRILLDWGKGAVIKVGDAQRVLIDQDHIIAVFENETPHEL